MDAVEIVSVFQPLYSVHEKKYIGVEALSRGLIRGEHLNAAELFSLPENGRETLELNRKCISSSLHNLKRQPDSGQYSIFLNIDSGLMDTGFFDTRDFCSSIVASGIQPQRIVVELIESRVKDFDRLLGFVKHCRECGFLIALDDVGAGYSNFERIVKIKPDIIKIDRGLVDGVSEEFHKREVCRSLIELAHNIGALSLAEGVESINDALECQDLGADIMQGFYFSRPKSDVLPVDITSGKIARLVETWNFSSKERSKKLQLSLDRVKRYSDTIHKALSSEDDADRDRILATCVEEMPDIECAYILNRDGIQISISAVRNNLVYKKHLLFTPARPGADHSQKYYFSRRAGGLKWYISDPYISHATGNICRTVSMQFADEEERTCYLCLDIR